MDGSIEGFRVQVVELAGRKTVCDTAGPEGAPAVLLLHGFPQTRLAWREVAPALAERYQVVSPDLPGYGQSERLEDGPAGFGKRRLGAHFAELMGSLGHQRFAVAGHDRGALVAFRMALDHPDRVTRLAVLDVIPSVDMWSALQGQAGVFAFHLYLLAHPPELPERMVGADPEAFFGHFLDAWTKVPLPAEIRAHYIEQCSRPEVIQAICDDYRASAFVDPADDEADRAAGKVVQVPTLAAWQDPGDTPLPFDPGQVWARWAPQLRTAVVPTGHFIPEEAPDELVAELEKLY